MTITLYTIASSPFCTQAKDYLTAKNLAFVERDVEHNKDNLNEMLTVSDHFTGVPFVHVVMDDTTEVGLKGFTEHEFDDVFERLSPQNATPVPEVTSQQTPKQPQNLSSNDNQTPTEIHDSPDVTAISQHEEPLYPSHTEPVPTTPTPQADADVAVSPSHVAQNTSPVPPTSSTTPVAQPEELGSVMKNLMQQSGQPLPPSDATNNDLKNPSPQFGGSELKQSSIALEDSKNIQEENANTQQATTQPTIPDFPK